MVYDYLAETTTPEMCIKFEYQGFEEMFPIVFSGMDGKLYCTFSGEKSLHLQSNIDVTWQYSKSSPVIAGIVGEDNRNLKLSVQYVSQNGLNIKARSKAGQIKEIILTPMP